MITKIISGGQTGADQGGLEAGKALSIPTGGTAPYNWMTEAGPQRQLLLNYGLRPGPPDPRTYPIRTKHNVRDSHGTIWFGPIGSPGYRCTLNACRDLHLPQLGVNKHWLENPTTEEFLEWITNSNIVILNVAGNRESKNPGIRARVRDFLVEALKPKEGQ